MAIDPKTGYYVLRDILGYNCKFNFVYSDRGRGKTYGTKLFLMEQEGRFMCLYLDSEDMAKALQSWTDALIESKAYKPEQFSWEGNEGGMQLLFNGEIKGYFRYLTAVRHIKHEKFPEVNRDEVINWVWMDEFITPDTKKLRGIKSIGDAIRMVLKTIDHDSAHPRETRGLKPVRMLLFANPFTWDNEINAYFHIVPMGYGIHRAGPDIVYEILEPLPDDGKMTVDKFLGDEVNKNIGYVKQTSYVAPMPKGAIPYISVRFGTEYFHLYKAPKNAPGEYYVKASNKHRETHSALTLERTVFGSLDGLQENETCIDKTNMVKYLSKLMYAGNLRYIDINVKFRFMNALINAKQ